MFDRFKVQLADEFSIGQVKTVAVYFGLPSAKRSEILESKNPAFALLTVLEDRNVIGEDIGIDELCKAFEFCSLNRHARIARGLKKRGSDLTDGGVVNTTISQEKLRTILQDELSRQKCIDVAMFLGLSESYRESIESHKKPGEKLFEILFDGQLIDDANVGVGVLVVALKNRGFHRVAKLIANAGTGQRVVDFKATPKAAGGSSIAKQLSGGNVELSKCICGGDKFDEVKLDNGKLVSVECQKCRNVWIAGAEAAKDEIMLRYNGEAFFYRTPLEMVLDLSKIYHETVNDASCLKRGDHIVMRRAGMYDHHAILVADVEQNKMHVVHWTIHWIAAAAAFASGEKKIEIENEKIQFPGEVRKVKYPIEDDPDLVVARAHMIYQTRDEQDYNLTKNNCETLATHCKIGKGYSIQGEALKQGRGLLAAGLRTIGNSSIRFDGIVMLILFLIIIHHVRDMFMLFFH